MTHTRLELEMELEALEQAVVQLLGEHEDPADFWPAFAGQADAIVDCSGPDDCQWLHGQIDAILARNGLDTQEP